MNVLHRPQCRGKYLLQWSMSKWEGRNALDEIEMCHYNTNFAISFYLSFVFNSIVIKWQKFIANNYICFAHFRTICSLFSVSIHPFISFDVCLSIFNQKLISFRLSNNLIVFIFLIFFLFFIELSSFKINTTNNEKKNRVFIPSSSIDIYFRCITCTTSQSMHVIV